MTVKRSESHGRSGFARLAIAILAPLVVIALAYALWWISDRLLYIGPLDRAAFGWSVVMPVWTAAPIVAGFAWRDLSSRGSLVAAVVVGVAVGIATASLLWQGAAFPDCEFGTNFTPLDWVWPSALIGAIVGVGPGAVGLFVARFVRQGWRWRAVALGATLALALTFVAIVVAGTTLMMLPACQRPPV